MTFVRRFLAFWYDFIVGDDWRVAVGGVILLAAAGALAHAGPNLPIPAWLLMPPGVVLILGISLRHATTGTSSELPIRAPLRQRSESA